MVLTLRAMTGGAGYAQRHLEHSDYYDEGRRVQGEWHGSGAELLGLRGEVTQEQFEAVREGLHPESGEFLRPRHSADRTDANGSEQSKGRSLYDLTFSAPKSISIQALVGGDDRLIAAHDKAVREALAEAENYAAARVRLNGANEDRATANWIVAAYRHDTSRELDPQLHTHAVTANLTYDGVEGRWKALQASGLYERRAYLTEVYRNALAREVYGLGYEIESRRDSKGRDHGFEICGVSDELLEKYSIRSAQRDAAIERFTVDHGRKPTNNEVAVLVRESRADKLTEISTERLRKLQQARLFPEEGRALKNLHKKSLKRTRHIPLEPLQEAESLQHAKEHLFERSSVVREHELMTEALRHGRGKIDRRQMRGALELEQLQGSLIRGGDNLATRESLERERRMVATVDGGIGRYERLGGEREFRTSERLREEQQRAVHQILNSRDFAINLRGAAGTGKTATLTEIARGLREAGREVLAVAPTRGAVEELQKVGFRDAMTISRLLEDPKAQAALHSRVLIVDEAGMVSGRQMEGLLKLAEREDARILFSGDTRQLQSVEASDALRILEQESRMKSVSLMAVQRQTQAEYRDAIQTLRNSPEQGLEKLEQLGAVREVPYLERAQAVASAYRALTSDPHRTVLVVAGTHEEIGKITEAVREDMKQRGELDRGIVSERFVPLQWTEARKKDLVNYRSGQVLLFHRSSRGIEKHEALIVERTDKTGIVAKDQYGIERTVSPTQARSFSVHECQQIEVAPGDKLLITGNRRDGAFRTTNGELVKVRNVDGDRIHLEDGRTLPANYHEFDHGYAVTAHRSQGKTVDAVILSADSMKQELFYVGASRGRQEIVVVTSDREQLRDLLGVSTARASATELAREQAQLHPAPKLNPEQSPLQTIEPSVLRKKDGHKHDLGISR
jgi:conjugative relaxase-like TrwC/TraI family protein